MPINLSIRNARDQSAQRLNQHTESHLSGPQDALPAIVDETVSPDWELRPAELLAKARNLGLHTPAESADIVRANRGWT
jgi:hypothetical protein